MVRPCSCLCQNVGWQEVPLAGEIAALARQDAGCERLMSVPGIGPIISSAGVAAAGTGEAFSKGRDFAAWLGLVPKQVSTGDRTILGKISKRGNSGGRRGRGLYLCRQRNFRRKNLLAGHLIRTGRRALGWTIFRFWRGASDALPEGPSLALPV